MAKLKGPLLSLDARGKIADTLVFTGWKGLKVVRQYVIPANPDTAAQQTQRGYMTAGVTQYRDVNLTAADKLAWETLASAQPKPMFGFNMFVKNYMDLAVAGKTYNLLHTLAVDTAVAEKATVTVEGTSEDLAPKVYWGTSPTALINSADIPHTTTGTYSYQVEGLSTGVKYYFTVIVTLEAKAGNRTGIIAATIT